VSCLLCTESGLWPVVYTVVCKCITSCLNLLLNISCGNSQALDSLAEALQSRAVARILYLSKNGLEDSIGQGLATKWHLDLSSHLATTYMGQKLGWGCAPLGGAGSPSNTMSPGPRSSYQVAS